MRIIARFDNFRIVELQMLRREAVRLRTAVGHKR